MSTGRELWRSAENFAEAAEQKPIWLLCGSSGLYFVVTSLLASLKIINPAEVFTFTIARLPSLGDIWSALLSGADLNPPLFYMVTRASLDLFGAGEWSLRLPAMIGFWLAGFCLFTFVARRSSVLYGLVAMLFIFRSISYYYAFDARPYGLGLGFAALALVCWQSATERRRRALSLIGLALSLAAAVSSHFYSVLVLFPLVVAELVRTFRSRRLDPPIWVAFALGLVPLILLLPLIESARTYSGTFWAKPDWHSIVSAYRFQLIGISLPVAGILVLSGMHSMSRKASSSEQMETFGLKLPLHELVAAFGFIALPIVVFALAKLITGAFTVGYAVASVIGFAIIFAFVAYRLFAGRAVLAATLALILLMPYLSRAYDRFGAFRSERQTQRNTIAFLREQNPDGWPIAIADSHLFMELSYYAPKDVASHLIYLADPRKAVEYLETDTADRARLELSRFVPLNVMAYRTFLASRRPFLVFWHVGGWQWLLQSLIDEHVRVELKDYRGADFLFVVNPRNDQS